MREASLTEMQRSLLERFKQIGGCVDYVVLECEGSEEPLSRESHQKAAIAAMETIGKRWEKYAIARSRNGKIWRERFFSLQIDHEKARSMQGTPISIMKFFGSRYNFDTGLIAIPQAGNMDGGYAYAFSWPPHGLSDGLTESDVTGLFDSINQEIVGGISQASIIYEWPTDWANYFNAGNEWWGAFLWTVANPGMDRIVALGASTTD